MGAKFEQEAEFERQIGARLRTLRQAAGLRQEDVAVRANAAGLPWSRSSVAALENGTCSLSAFEWLALPAVYRCTTEMILAGIEAVPSGPVPGASELERTAADRLGIRPEEVAETALRLWGRGIAAERDARPVKGSGRSAQSARGHIARTLIAELADALAAEGAS